MKNFFMKYWKVIFIVFIVVGCVAILSFVLTLNNTKNSENNSHSSMTDKKENLENEKIDNNVLLDSSEETKPSETTKPSEPQIQELVVTPQIIENSSCINASCIESIIGKVVVSGGSGNYTYTLTLTEPAGVSKVVHTSSVECSGKSLYNGTYTLKYEVKDSNGNTKTGTKTYVRNKTVDSGEPLKASARLTTQRSYKGGNYTDQVVISIQHSGGSKPYKVEYTLYRDGIVVAKTGAPLEKKVNSTTTYLNFVAGNYTLNYTVTDGNGKKISDETSATFETVL